MVLTDKHYSLLVPFVGYAENEVLRNWALVLYSQHFIFIVTYECAQMIRTLHNTRLDRLERDKHSNLFGPFESYKDNKCYEQSLELGRYD